MFKILVADKLGQAGIERLAAASDAQFDVKLKLSKEDLIGIIGAYDALIVRSDTRPDAEIIAAATNLKVIGRAGMGVDNIDVPAATARGIIVMNTPAANSMATAELAMGLMLAASRHIAHAHASVARGEWERSQFVGQQLYQKRLGIIGFGRIGRLVAERAQAFGMQVIAYDPYVSEEIGRDLGVTLVDLDDLLAQSDYITLHTASTPETTNILDAAAIAQMKDGVILVNAARGKLVDEEALVAALNSGKIKCAAVDVYRHEPPTGSPLVNHPKVVHVPHLGASTVEAQRDVATQIVDQVLDALRGDDYRNAVNLPFRPGPDFPVSRPYLELAEKLGRLQAILADSPIRRLEIELAGDVLTDLVRPIAAALLKGLLMDKLGDSVNYINAPLLAHEQGIVIAQTKGLSSADYPNRISCHAYWDGGARLLSGVIFGGAEPRIVQFDDYALEAKPDGVVLYLRNRDIPGVIGQVGTILAAYLVNIAEWRMGRVYPGGEALCFINLDSQPPEAVVDALARIPAILDVRLFNL